MNDSDTVTVELPQYLFVIRIPDRRPPVWEVVVCWINNVTGKTELITRAYRAWTKSEARARHKEHAKRMTGYGKIHPGTVFAKRDNVPVRIHDGMVIN